MTRTVTVVDTLAPIVNGVEHGRHKKGSTANEMAPGESDRLREVRTSIKVGETGLNGGVGDGCYGNQGC